MAFPRIIPVTSIVFAALSGCPSTHARQPSPYVTAPVRPPIISPVEEPAAYHYVEFNARYGPGSITGHLNTRTVAVLQNGQHRLTSLFGLYAAGGALEYAASVVGTPGKVGYTWLDLKVRPVARYRVRISVATHARLLRAARHYAKTIKWFELFNTNCNYLVARVATIIGLRAPDSFAQLPDDYLRQLRALNKRN